MLPLISKFIHPNNVIYVFYLSFLSTLIELFLIKVFTRKNIFINIFFILSFLLFSVYFRLSFTILILLLFFSLSSIPYKLFPEIKNKFFLTFGLLIFSIQIYLTIGLIINPKISLILIIFILSLSVFYKKKLNRNILDHLHQNLVVFIKNLNIIDLLVINLSFIISSQPQYHWDAAMANLYNAKWYVLQNSFAPILESISSLFPQNGVAYFSFFYQLGNFKGIQFSLLLPLIILIYFLKEIFKKYNFHNSLQLLSYTTIFSPIVIFQSSNGYYDLLLLVICLIAVYCCFLYLEKPKLYLVYIASFLIGYAAGMKYFPLVFFFLPLLAIYLSKIHSTVNNYILIIVLLLLPLTVWSIRTYNFSGSPVFPFAQFLFPTPKLWLPNDILENNFMIQSPINKFQWLMGGFIIYPVITYIKTNLFLEATSGYTTLAYILFTAISIIFISKTLLQIFKQIKISRIQIIFLYSFIAYILVGVITRYYRYLWPYQFIFSLIALIFISKNNSSKLTKAITILSFLIIILNAFNTYKYFRAYPLSPKQFFNPDYYSQENSENGPITFINKLTNNDIHKKILDASNFILPRINFSAQTYQCNWYWIGWQNIFNSNNKSNNILQSFDFIITNNPIDKSNNYCQDLIVAKLSKSPPIYEDQNYLIYEIKK